MDRNGKGVFLYEEMGCGAAALPDDDEAQRGYAEECALLVKQKGFDEYSSKWQKKIDKIADKYSRILYPLQVEHEEIRERINEAEEEKR